MNSTEMNKADIAPKITAKTPKGTRDIQPVAMAIREQAFAKIKQVFYNHGAVSIDTPVFERREVLQNKYGEDSKLIYDLSDDMSRETGEKLSLRYDLSVPFARYIASNNVTNIKRFHIGKVYRRDSPAIERGRFREFYQCDFDIAGQYPSMIADAEVLMVMMEMFDTLAATSEHHEKLLGNYRIKISNRVILDAILSVCGVPDDQIRSVCSAVDKLDKTSWEEIRNDMICDMDLSGATIDNIKRFVQLKGAPEDILQRLREEKQLAALCTEELDKMEKLFKLVRVMRDQLPERLSFDLSLARGLDYYTGVIFETVLMDKGTKLGSIGAGGRYDNLVGMFRKKSIPCVGCSLGIERIMSVMVRAAEAAGGVRASCSDVLVGSEKGDMSGRMRIAAELWRGGVASEFSYNENWNLTKQLAAALKARIPLLVFVGKQEMERGEVLVKNLAMEEQRFVARSDVVRAVQEELAKAK